MQNERPGAQGWGLAAATRQLIDTADSAEAGRRTPQVERAIAAFLAQPAGSPSHLDDARADQALILAHHFRVDESYFTDARAAEAVIDRRKRGEPEPGRVPQMPAPRTATADDEVRVEAHKPRPLAGVALATTGVLVGAAIGGAVGYHAGDGAGRSAGLAEGLAHERSAHEQFAHEQFAREPGDRHGVADPIQEAARRLMPAVVRLRVQAGTNTTTGSGVVLTPDGMLLTNDHVIAATAKGGQLTVQFQNGMSRPAHVVGRDPAADIAVVAADNLTGLAPVKLGNSDSVHPGEPVFALGAAEAMTRGVVGAVNRPVVVGQNEATKAPEVLNAIQTDAAVNPADSGGPLVDAHGMVIGIETSAAAVAGEAVPAGTSRAGYAIPANQAARIAMQLIDTSRGIQPLLGVKVGITGHPGQPNGVAPNGPVPNTPAGAKIVAVAPGSPAGNAGLKAGDVVVKFNGHPVTSGEEFIAETRTLAPADTVQLSNGQSAHIVLAARPVAASK